MIIFTLCSNNYLAQAKALGDSIKRTSPDYRFFIGLCDQLNSEIDYVNDIGHPIIPCDEIGIPDFDSLWKKYTIIEFNTCVKPFYFNYFINNYPGIEFLYYFDPDIYVFNNLKEIEKEFKEDGEILLTPHILTPINIDDKLPNEQLFLNFGIYNLGFLGLRKPHKNRQLIEWWMDRTYHLGYYRPAKGLFVDQLWMNFVPLFFDHVIISKHPGLNMAPWNLHERTLSISGQTWYVNDSFPLVFYHFSNYRYIDSNSIAKNYNRYDFSTNPDLKDIYQEYHELMLLNGVQKMEKMSCSYMDLRAKYLIEKIPNTPRRRLVKYLERVLPKNIFKVIKVIRS